MNYDNNDRPHVTNTTQQESKSARRHAAWSAFKHSFARNWKCHLWARNSLVMKSGIGINPKQNHIMFKGHVSISEPKWFLSKLFVKMTGGGIWAKYHCYATMNNWLVFGTKKMFLLPPFNSTPQLLFTTDIARYWTLNSLYKVTESNQIWTHGPVIKSGYFISNIYTVDTSSQIYRQWILHLKNINSGYFISNI